MSETREDDATTDVARTLGSASHSRHASESLADPRGVAGLVLIALLLMALRSGDDGLRYSTEPARLGDLTVLSDSYRDAAADEPGRLGSELSGIVRTVSADFNDIVKVGQELAKLDTRSSSRGAAVARRGRLRRGPGRAGAGDAGRGRESDRAPRHVRELSGGKVPSPADFDTAERSRAARLPRTWPAPKASSRRHSHADGPTHRPGQGVDQVADQRIVLTRTVEPGATVAASLQAPVLFTAGGGSDAHGAARLGRRSRRLGR